MPTVVAIIGAGELGASVASHLAHRDHVARILLVDDAGGVAAGKALDIQQACAVSGAHTHLVGTTDVSKASGCDVCVVADPASAGADLPALEHLGSFVHRAPFVLAAPLDARQFAHAVRETGLAPDRLLGSAPEGYAGAVRALIALEAGCSPGEIELAVLGTPSAFVVPWTEGSVHGSRLDQVLSAPQIVRLEALLPRLWPPGVGTLGVAAARIVEGLLGRSRRRASVLAMLDGEFGARGVAGVVPVRLGPAGLVRIEAPVLSVRDRTRVATSLGL